MEQESKNIIGDGVKKKIVQDISDAPQKNFVSGIGRRSIRDIPIPQNGGVIKKKYAEPESKNLDENISEGPEEVLSRHSTPYKKETPKYVLWGIVLVSVLVLVFAITSLFSGATVTLVPKQQYITVNGSFMATQSTEDGPLNYQMVQISDTVSQVVESDSVQEVEQKARGSIVIFNAHSSASQTLIEQTRFETPDGKIYRIQEEITVPGQNTVNGETVPGQIEVTVYADQPGDAYNIGLTEFTIPGFKGDSRFENFYARSKTPMTSGFIGTKPVVDEETEERVSRELQQTLQDRLTSELQNRIAGKILIPENGTFFTFEPLPATQNNNGGVEVVLKGTLSAVGFTTAAVAEAILTQAGGATNNPVRIQNVEEISINLENAESFNIQNDQEIRVQMSGDAHLVWQFDEQVIKNELAGNKKSYLSTIPQSYESVDRAKAVIRPIWNRSFSSNPEDITIKIELE